MFEREHHRRIAALLAALDTARLDACHCLFGGGTAMALRHGEYRESVDVDFLVSDGAGYCQLRQLLTGAQGFQPLARTGQTLVHAREVRADQYGIRTLLRLDDVPIKFEIVFEARIALEAPGTGDVLCGIHTLTPLDMATSKLLANADRWRDASALSRDLIDLAMMVPPRALLARAIGKAERPYGESITSALAKAIQHLRDDPRRLEDCMRMMRMTLAPALVWKRIKALVPRARQ